ncbi:MAG: hypothetical protein AB1426_10690 [Bacillota bacterium]
MGSGEREPGLKARLKLRGGFILAAIILGIVDFLFYLLPRMLPFRRRKRPAGRMVFKVRD